MIGVESGHAIGSSLAILRTLYELGARSTINLERNNYTYFPGT